MKDEAETFEELVVLARRYYEVEDEEDKFANMAYRGIFLVLIERDDRETLDKLLFMTRGDVFERRFSATVLGRMGESGGSAAAEITDILLKMLDVEQDEKVLTFILPALGHQNNDVRVPALLSRFVNHPRWHVRWHVAIGLDGYTSPEAIEMLISLTSDKEASVREWATFVLGKQENMDSPEIRAALVARLDDEDVATRAEALYALAERKEARVVPAVLQEFDEEAHSPTFDSLTDSLDYRLLPALYAMSKDLQYLGDPLELKAAIAKCEAHLERNDYEN